MNRTVDASYLRHSNLLKSIGMIVALMLTSCATNKYRMYSGPCLSKDEVSFLHTVPLESSGMASILVHSFDGKEVTLNFRNHTIEVEFLPGRHIITVDSGERKKRATSSSKSFIPIQFDSKPGHIYSIAWNDLASTESRYGWNLCIRDETSDGVIVAEGAPRDSSGIDTWIAVLKDENPEFRREAALVVGEIKDQSVAGAMIAALKDEDPWVRLYAARALGKIKDPRAIDALAAALKDENQKIRGEAALSLGEIKDPRVVDALIAALEDEDPFVRLYAARALGKTKDPRAIDALTAALKDKDRRVLGAAAVALGEIKDPHVVDVLIAALKDEDPWVRLYAARALGKLKDPRAIDSLTAALKDKNRKVRDVAALALGEIKDRRAVGPLIETLQDESVLRVNVTNALRQITGETYGDDIVRWQIWWNENKETFLGPK